MENLDFNDTLAKAATDAYIRLHDDELKSLNINDFTFAYVTLYEESKKSVDSLLKSREENTRVASLLK